MHGHKSLPSRVWGFGAKQPGRPSGRGVAREGVVRAMGDGRHGLEEAREQIRLAHRYKNDLCRAELDRRARSEAVLREMRPGLLELDGQVTLLTEQIEVVARALAAEKARTRKAPSAEARTAVKDAKANLKDAKGRLRAARKEAYAAPDVREKLAEVEQWHKNRIKELRELSNLYWGNYLVCEQACQSFRSGPPPRFRRFDGQGSVTVQLQGGLSVADLFGGADSRLRLVPVGGTKRAAVVWLRVGSEGRAPVWCVASVVLHRLPPDDAVVKWARLCVRRVGTREEWELQLVLSREVGWEKEGGGEKGVVAINPGWRVMEDGSLRVATWVGDDGQVGELRLPAREVSVRDHAGELRGLRDRLFDQAKIRLQEWLRGNKEICPPWLLERTETLGQWKSAARLASVVLHWRENRFSGDAEVFGWLEGRLVVGADGKRRYEGWRKQDKHLYDWAESVVLKAIRRRNKLYQNFASNREWGLRGKYRTVVLAKTNWKEVGKKPAKEEETTVNKTAARHRQIASPGILTQTLASAFRQVAKCDAKHITQTCAACEKLDAFDAASLVMRTCQHCGFEEDQDVRACKNMLKAYANGKAVVESPETAREEEEQED